MHFGIFKGKELLRLITSKCAVSVPPLFFIDRVLAHFVVGFS